MPAMLMVAVKHCICEVKRQLQYALLSPARSNMQTSSTDTAGMAAQAAKSDCFAQLF